jgi:ABC-2 type transport system ATP-binding protein
VLELGPPATLVRGLDSPVRISIESGQLSPAEAAAVASSADAGGPGAVGPGAGGPAAGGPGAHGAGPGEVSDDGVLLTFATREPAPVLSSLAERHALAGLRVQGATLEDVFLKLTGREYRG